MTDSSPTALSPAGSEVSTPPPTPQPVVPPGPPTPPHLHRVTSTDLATWHSPFRRNLEVVDGVVFHLPDFDDVDFCCNLVRALYIFLGNICPPNLIPATSITVQIRRAPDAFGPTRRAPHIVLLDIAQRDEPASSTDSLSDCGISAVKARSPAEAHFQLTTSGTREDDLCTKWAENARTGVHFYFIVDLPRASGYPVPRLIVGSTEPFGILSHESPRATDGHPDNEPSEVEEAAATLPLYYKQVFEADDIVDCGVFERYPVTVRQLADSAKLNELSIALRGLRDA